jgi:hypothetical protein
MVYSGRVNLHQVVGGLSYRQAMQAVLILN